MSTILHFKGVMHTQDRGLRGSSESISVPSLSSMLIENLRSAR